MLTQKPQRLRYHRRGALRQPDGLHRLFDFDDLQIGNFMKTTLHGLDSLNAKPGEFNDSVAKFGDDGQTETAAEIEKGSA